MTPAKSPVADDLLISADAIAIYLGLPDHRRARRLIENDGLPHFYIGGRLAARKSKLDAWIADLEARGGQRPPKRGGRS
jgi:hypothetical protein